MNFKKLVALLEVLVENQDKSDAYISSIPSDIQSAFFDNTIVNALEMQKDYMLKMILGESLYEEVCWFLYEWKSSSVGTTITTNDTEYVINNFSDYINYLKEVYAL